MKEDLSKIDALLLFAMQQGEDNFKVSIGYKSGDVLHASSLTKDEILKISCGDTVSLIQLSKRQSIRRWRTRSNKCRRT